MTGATVKIWNQWRRLSHRAAAVQSHVVLFALYTVVVIPMASLARINRKARAGTPVWHSLPQDAPSLESARNQS